MKKKLVAITCFAVAAAMTVTPVMASSLQDTFSSIISEISSAAQDKINEISEGVVQAGDDIEMSIGDFSHSVEEAYDSAAETVDEVKQEVVDAVEQAVPGDTSALDGILGTWDVRAMQRDEGEVQNAYGEWIITRDYVYMDGEPVTYEIDGDRFTLHSPTDGDVSGTFVIGDYEPIGADNGALSDDQTKLLDADPSDGLTLFAEMVDATDPLIQKPFIQKVYLRKSLYSSDAYGFAEKYLIGKWSLDSGLDLTFEEAQETEDGKADATVTTSTGMTGTWDVYCYGNSADDDGVFDIELTIHWDGSTSYYMIAMSDIKADCFIMTQKNDPSAKITATLTE